MQLTLQTVGIPLEIFITIGILLIQFKFFLSTKTKIKLLSKLFPTEGKPYIVKSVTVNKLDQSILDKTLANIDDHNSNDYYVVDLIALKQSNLNDHPVFRNILDATNKYLKSNKGAAADFNILQDITERISNSEEESISNVISLPLFIGLMGTFLGVIIGLIFIFLGSDGNSSQIITEETIQKFLGGVLIAMCGSLMGLFLTTLNNSLFFKEAKSNRDKAKNIYYNFLQSELLPVLNKDLSSSLTSLKLTFDLVNQELSNNLVNKLQEFNSSLSTNVQNFNKNIEPISENLKLQRDFLDKMKDLGLKKVVEANLGIFKKITESTDTFNSLFELAQALNNSVSKSNQTAEKIDKLLNRVVNFEDSINNLSNTINDHDLTFIEIGEYLRAKLDDIKSRYNLVKEHVNLSNDEITKYLADEKNKIDNLLKQINSILSSNITVINEEIIREIKKSYEELRNNNIGKDLQILSDRLDKLSNELMKKVSPSDKILYQLNENFGMVTEQLITLNRKISPSIINPLRWFKFHFSRNGKAINEKRLA